ncbi:MAG TPA: DUF2780 domain-containing protein [Terriglobales bacterium]
MKLPITLVCLLAMVFAAASATAQSAATGLIGQLSNGLNISQTQAKGGAGALFGLAKSRLSLSEFGQVANSVPNMPALLKAAPATGSSSELASLESAVGSSGSMGSLGRLAETAEAFHKLGLSPDMATKFVPIMTKYVESKGGSSTASLLEKAWK